jgi:two-component system, OmpR family, alkaline phosphatase synthesis response regulator PhoP
VGDTLAQQDQILVIEDDRELVDVLCNRLAREGFTVQYTYDGVEGYKTAANSNPSLVLLDLMLPGMRGMDVCRQLKEKEHTRHIPVVMLTANAEEADVVLGLEFGADDYITKPFNFRQLVARIRAVLRRSNLQRSGSPPVRITLGPLEIDSAAREVRVYKKPVALTESEFQLLYKLASNAGQVCNRTDLLHLLSGGASLVERNVDVHIASLRKKLGSMGKYIITVRSIGYKCATHEQLAQETNSIAEVSL